MPSRAHEAFPAPEDARKGAMLPLGRRDGYRFVVVSPLDLGPESVMAPVMPVESVIVPVGAIAPLVPTVPMPVVSLIAAVPEVSVAASSLPLHPAATSRPPKAARARRFRVFIVISLVEGKSVIDRRVKWQSAHHARQKCRLFGRLTRFPPPAGRAPWLSVLSDRSRQTQPGFHRA